MKGGAPNPVGLTAADLATWRYGDVAAGFAAYADPALEFDLSVPEFQGRKFILIEIREFDEAPRSPQNDLPGAVAGATGYTPRRGVLCPWSRQAGNLGDPDADRDARIAQSGDREGRAAFPRALSVGLQLPGGATAEDKEEFSRQLGNPGARS